MGTKRKIQHESEALQSLANISPPLHSFIHMGDLHYDDIGTSDVGAFHASTNKAVSYSHMQRMLSQVPLVYVWDDHDYGENNSGALSRSRAVS